jgi:acetyl-CoA synthetase
MATQDTQFYIDAAEYQTLYEASLKDPNNFWGTQANEFITWHKPWQKVSDCDLKIGKVRWYVGGQLNAAYNCLDRHLEKHDHDTALIWEGNDPKDSLKYTYQELYTQVCKFANVLLTLGVKPGDRVCIYMPLIPEIVISMLACARIGAVHSVVFGGFSSEALRDRIVDCSCKIVITANEGLRGDKVIPLKANVDQAIANLSQITDVIVIERTNAATSFNPKIDRDYNKLMADANTTSDCHMVDAEHPLFILYTSGSTGKPKGAQHSTGGYLTYAALTFHYVFDYHPGEIYWCSADAGWITGHTYLVYGPLANAATILMYEGVPAYPDAARMWQIIDKYQVNIFYTAPTLIRALMSHGDEFLKTTKRDSLRILGTVGEPINPAAWEWFYYKVGHGQCPIVDTWWQTETGGIMISPLPGATDLKPGSATKPLFGIKPTILDNDGKEIKDHTEGNLVICDPWPGLMQTIYGDQKRFVDTYFTRFPGYYLAGDAAKCDNDGYYWIIGRNDDVLKISGHRIGTAEVESALVKNPAVAEAAVVGIADAITGEAIYAYVQLKDGQYGSDQLKQQLVAGVKTEVGSFAAPKTIRFAKELPKTRSGKIMRRILRKIAEGKTEDLGDISTLGNPEAVTQLINDKQL